MWLRQAQPPCMKIIFMLSHQVWKLFLCSFVLFFKRKGFYYWIAFLSMLSWRNSFAMKLYGNCYLNRLFSITKFTESRWNDSVFECSEEHRNSKSGDFAQQYFFKIELLMLWKYNICKSFCIFEWCNLHSEFAKSQERKQTSFSGLRKSAEPLVVILYRQRE